MHERDRGTDELTRRLEVYAEARLSPELSATTRMRARVMAAAHRHAALARADADRAAAAGAATARAERTRGMSWRRPLTALLAAGMALAVGAGSVAAAQAGGPLYGVRVWAETLTLPDSASERAQAEIHRLQQRLAEAAAATASGDSNAANAALDAYASILDEATVEAAGDSAAAATLDTGVRNNIQVLTVLLDRVPEQARDAIQHAIDNSDSAIERIRGNQNGHPQGGPPGRPPGPPDVPPGQASRSPEPDATTDAEKSPNPNRPSRDPADKTPKPHPTPKADAAAAGDTAEPDRTPRGGGRPSDPGGGDGGGNAGVGGNGGGAD